LAEFVQIKMQEQLALQSTIDEKEMDMEDARKALTEYELKYRQQELRLDEIEKKLHKDTLEFEKKLAACESTVSFLKDREIELQKKCAVANEKAHQAEVQTAVANTKAENFQNIIKDLKQREK
ncbi:MAG: hypothetical protein K2X39_03020, partial [Silvanigrellaceae bacterium]|nr:hypothetical protein [Silvanigrellaceae bacterium]